MDVVISHMAALRLLRVRRYLPLGWKDAALPLPNEMPAPADALELKRLMPELADLEGPLGILVSRKAAVHKSRAFTARAIARPLPAGSLIWLAPGIRCTSPLLLPVLLAGVLKELELQMLLAELLGLYSICDQGLIQRREPLVTRNELEAFLDSLGPMKGVAVVRRALRNAPVMAASPQEAKLYIRVTRPFLRGGYQMGEVVLNDPVAIERITGASLRFRKPDLLFLSGEKGVCLDYMGAWHDSEPNVRRDAARRNELLAAGFKPYEIFKNQYNNLDYMDGLMVRIREDLGLYKPRPKKSVKVARRRARYELWRELEAIDLRAWEHRLELR